MEIRLHGRGGQGGVTCAKLLASMYARLGNSVQTFGDYAGERSGAPIRAYTRVSDTPIENRNKVYEPDHLVVLDASLATPDALAGLARGGTLLLNSADAPQTLAERFPGCRIATVDATAIARKHGIGTRSLVIVNTTIAGAWARIFDVPMAIVEETYGHMGFEGNLPAARDAWEAVRTHDSPGERPAAQAPGPAPVVEPLITHVEGPPTPVKTGSWRSQMPQWIVGRAPCTAACPVDIDVVGFVQALDGEGPAAAAAVLARSTPLPGVCGRLCPAPCMTGCNRRTQDGAVNVKGLERLVAEYPEDMPAAPLSDAPRRITVVGGGAAGLGAAWTVAQLGHRARVIEARPELGGWLADGPSADELPRAVLERDLRRVIAAGIEVRCGTRVDPEGLARLTREADGVILATGSTPLALPPGDQAAVPLVDLAGSRKRDRSVAHALGVGRSAAAKLLADLGAVAPGAGEAAGGRRKTVGHRTIRHEHFAPAPPALCADGAGLDDACEAQRCYSCGRCTQCDVCLVYCPEGIVHRLGAGYEADAEYCKGCGICAVECPRGALEMT